MSSNERNDLLYVCSLIEYVGRKTNNHRSYIVDCIGYDGLKHLYNNASINHNLSFEQVSDELIEDYNIFNGSFDTISKCHEKVPSYISIGSVYKRMIIALNNGDIIDTIYNIFKSFISDEISNFDSDLYYQNNSYLCACYKENKILD